jgi:SecD/SecF fusion protein
LLPFQYEISGEGKTTEDGKNHVMMLRFEGDLKAADLEHVRTALRKTEEGFADRPQPDRLENFDSQLAIETRLRAMWAILASWAAILVYLWFRFGNWTFGIAAVLCLMHDLFLTLGAIAACHFIAGSAMGNLLGVEDFKIDLSAVAALLTLVGYSVNDTIVVFDRIREVRGKNPDLTPQMINDSVNQTLSRTLIASLTTWIVCFILYAFGGPGVKLFGFVMVVGVIVGTYSSIYIASPLLLLFGEGVHEETGIAKHEPEPEGAPA